MGKLLRSLLKQQLTRLDVWLIFLMGITMILTLSASLIEAELLSETAQFLPTPENVHTSLTEVERINRHVVRTGFFIFQFITVVLLFLVLLGDPMNNSRTTSFIATYPISRPVLFLVESLSHFGALTVLATLLWIPSLFNALYAGVYVQPVILGTLFFVIKLMVIYSLYLATRSIVHRSLGVIVTMLFYVLARFDRYLFVLSEQQSNPWGWITWTVSLLLPPFDRLDEAVLTAYAGAPIDFLLGMVHVIVLLGVLTGVAWWHHLNRDLPPA